jgi:outer membrane protein
MSFELAFALRICFYLIMKNLLKIILSAILLMTVLSGSALAQTKIATVDLRKLFDNYWKTKQAQTSIQSEAARLDKDDKTMKDSLRKGNDDYQKLLAQAFDQAISAEERDKRKQTADAKLKQLREAQTAITQFETQAQSRLTDQKMQMRQKVLVDIQSAVSAKAKAGGYSLVVDTAAETVNGTPIILFSNGENDLTDALLSQLNVGAPIDISNPVAMPSAPSLLTTNRF